MLKLLKIAPRIWVDEKNVVYKKKGHTRVEASDGRILRAPRLGEKIFLDGQGNGLLFT
jgi:hypothetical protein